MPTRPHRGLSAAACSLLLALPAAALCQEGPAADAAPTPPAEGTSPTPPGSEPDAPAGSAEPVAVAPAAAQAETAEATEAIPGVPSPIEPPQARAEAAPSSGVQAQAAVPPPPVVLKLDLTGVSRLQDVDVGSPAWGTPSRPGRASSADPDPRDRALVAERERARASDLRPITPGAPERAPTVRFKRKF